MRLLKTINLDRVSEKSTASWKRRTAARAVVFDSNGRVGLLHVTKNDYYKLPGGGVEAGEDIKKALDRECEEELGVSIQVSDEVGEVIEYRARWQLVQTSFCFLAKVVKDLGGPNFTKSERKRGFEIVWVTPQEARKLLGLKKTTDYEGKFIEERDSAMFEAAIKVLN